MVAETELIEREMGESELRVCVPLPVAFSALPPHEREREVERAMTTAWESMVREMRIRYVPRTLEPAR